MKPLFISEETETFRADLAATARSLYEQGWMPGTSGNLSVRSGEAVLITASGRSKRTLCEHDTVLVDPDGGSPLTGESEWPSAETSIHLAVYRGLSDASAVIHAHTPYATALATLAGTGEGGGRVVFEELELAKGLGVADPLRVELPVLANWTDVQRIAADAAAHLDPMPSNLAPALLVERHGVTVWGATLDQARDRLECVEELSRLALLTADRSNPTALGANR
ncbi:methylthioribulose 1-phosphate dehydratase [Streptomyces sp. NPDC101178]|uniref:methylthioribulose 1-phosphate dehydratase n=1 Tax=Streptomyces sp. NPDC101178 TaxID=3366124 RepID=UPI0037F6E209